MATFLAYVANETDKAKGLALATMDLDSPVKLCWMPISKIESLIECDDSDRSIVVVGESISRKATPYMVTVADDFLARIGAKV